MYKDCFCFDDKHIPYIEIENNMILVKFPLNGDLIGFEFKKFYDFYVQTSPSTVCEYNDKLYCQNCINNYQCQNHKINPIIYCYDCEKYFCENCKNKHDNHSNIPYGEIENKKRVLKEFIETLILKIKKLEDILNDMKNKLDFCESILMRNNYLPTKEMIINLKNLKINNEKENYDTIDEIINKLKSIDFNFFIKKNNENLQKGKDGLESSNKTKNIQEDNHSNNVNNGFIDNKKKIQMKVLVIFLKVKAS